MQRRLVLMLSFLLSGVSCLEELLTCQLDSQSAALEAPATLEAEDVRDEKAPKVQGSSVRELSQSTYGICRGEGEGGEANQAHLTTSPPQCLHLISMRI